MTNPQSQVLSSRSALRAEGQNPKTIQKSPSQTARRREIIGLLHFASFQATFLLVTAFLFALTPRVSAQTYAIDWFTLGGGGGVSTGGGYSVTGTIGQPEAGKMSGGNYTLDGGFWSILAVVQTPGKPTLTIAGSGTQAIISWPSPSTGFELEQNTTLEPTAWTTVSQTPNDDGTVKSLTVPTTVGARFYRLKAN